jgi:hypothetical protein
MSMPTAFLMNAFPILPVPITATVLRLLRLPETARMGARKASGFPRVFPTDVTCAQRSP